MTIGETARDIGREKACFLTQLEHYLQWRVPPGIDARPLAQQAALHFQPPRDPQKRSHFIDASNRATHTSLIPIWRDRLRHDRQALLLYINDRLQNDYPQFHANLIRLKPAETLLVYFFHDVLKFDKKTVSEITGLSYDDTKQLHEKALRSLVEGLRQ